MEKTRKEKRKEARLEKAAAKHTFRLKRQKGAKSFQGVMSNGARVSGVNTGRVSELDDDDDEVERKGIDIETEWEPSPNKDGDVVVVPPERAPKLVRAKKGLKKKTKKTNFEKFLEMDERNGSASADEDLEMERRLARKLKVKSGKLRGEDDELNEMFDGLSSILDSAGEEDGLPVKKSGKISKKRKVENSLDNSIDEVSEPIADVYDSAEVSEEAPSKVLSKKKRKVSGGRPESIAAENPTAEEVDVPSKAQKYVAPHLRSRVEGTELEEHSQARRRVRGLLNRVSESNVESITGEVSAIFRSMPRSIASQMICEEVLASCSSGPRGNEQYAAVFAAFVAGMACSVGVDFGAKLMASLAKNFEEEYHKKDNLSVRNLTLLFSYLYIFGVCSSDLIYDFITVLGQRLMEVDVSTILTVLQCCGIKIRADDPLSMKSFIVSVQSRVNELKASSGDDKSNINSKRMEFMLETILDIKNNKKRPKEDSAHHTRIKKWLQKLRVEGIVIRGLTWSKLLDPEKKGQWWSSTGDASTIDNVEEVANTIDKEVVEAQKMLQLASGQRMNTEARKAIFCVVMSSEDYIDAFEKLLRLDLPGKQDREVMRVLLHCCLQEKVFNKYYVVLASKLCEHEKNHKFTLQYCLWDHFKEVESMELSRSLNLARFVAETIAAFTLSFAVLKVVDLNDISQLTPKRTMHFRMLFEALFEYPDKVLWNVFTRVAVIPELESLRQGTEFFVKEYVAKSNKAVRGKLKFLKKALNNVEGILM